jgi:dipeptidyl aminopeptidase/acylaminoacyl peptidase
MNLEARDLVAPFTQGALRGGTHVHVFDPTGRRVSFTYNDDVCHREQRNVGVSVPGQRIRLKHDHPRNHEGESFSVLVTRTVSNPRPGSDEIRRAVEDAWVGPTGRRIAFQGEVITREGQPIWEVFVLDLPEDLSISGDGRLEGSAADLPAPPLGTIQRRLTCGRGLCGPRHWLRSSPDGARIAFLMQDDQGVAQLWTVSPEAGASTEVTHDPHPIASAFSWSPDGRWIAHVRDDSVFLTDINSGEGRRLTQRREGDEAPRPEACVFSPDGSRVAFVRRVDGFNQIFIVPT